MNRTEVLNYEEELFVSGAQLIAGVDEVGRGAWAGRVSVGVALLDRDSLDSPLSNQVCDSKSISERRREQLYEIAIQWCKSWAVGSATNHECDTLGMRVALHLAACRAIEEISEQTGYTPEGFLLDGNMDFLNGPYSQSPRKVVTIVKGDQHSKLIGAASIIAKVVRDREMISLSDSFPGFDFHINKGYPSPVHKRALVGYGPTSIHRVSWASMNLVPWFSPTSRAF